MVTRLVPRVYDVIYNEAKKHAKKWFRILQNWDDLVLLKEVGFALKNFVAPPPPNKKICSHFVKLGWFGFMKRSWVWVGISCNMNFYYPCLILRFWIFFFFFWWFFRTICSAICLCLKSLKKGRCTKILCGFWK